MITTFLILTLISWIKSKQNELGLEHVRPTQAPKTMCPKDQRID